MARNTATQLERAAPLFAALGDETRIRLVARLSRGGPASLAGLTAGSTVTRQAVAKHLRVLENAGLVRGERQGRESLWTLEPKKLEDARACLLEIATRWDDALSRLKELVEA